MSCTLERKIIQLLKIKHKALVIGLTLLCLTTAGFLSSGTSASTAAAINTTQNEQLDFTLVNRTGYSIKLLYIGPSNNPEWTDEMEFLKGKEFKTGTQMGVRFNPKTKSKKWDIMVKWTDGSKSAEWLGLDLTTIEKLTILYDADTDKTTYRIN